MIWAETHFSHVVHFFTANSSTFHSLHGMKMRERKLCVAFQFIFNVMYFQIGIGLICVPLLSVARAH